MNEQTRNLTLMSPDVSQFKHLHCLSELFSQICYNMRKTEKIKAILSE